MNNLILTTPEELKSLISEAIKSELTNQQSQPAPEKETVFLTRKEATKLLKISLPTLHEWTKSGKIPSTRIGKSIRYNKQELLDAIASKGIKKYQNTIR